jgi:hypothetical protein
MIVGAITVSSATSSWFDEQLPNPTCPRASPQ